MDRIDAVNLSILRELLPPTALLLPIIILLNYVCDLTSEASIMFVPLRALSEDLSMPNEVIMVMYLYLQCPQGRKMTTSLVL